MNITLRQMSYFKTLSEQRNFRRAAEVSNISQPALSIQIKEMEERLGAQLVERQARDIVLTPFGRLILDHCLQVLKAAQALDDAAKWHGARRGRLSIGVIPTIAPYLLPDVLAQLRARDLELPSAGTDFIDEPLFEDRFLLAGTQTRLSQYADPLIASELQSGQLMLLEEGNCLTDQALQVCGRTRSHPQINMGASSMATLTRLVATGFGVTLMPELAARAEQFSVEGLSLRRFSDVEPSRRIGLVRRASTPREAWVVSLIDILRDVGQGIVARCRADV
jgi:LysR family hydrogen peroxide-inducible transcriptional activator